MTLTKANLLLTIVFLLAAPLVMARPKVAESYHYYTIEPKNSKDLQAALDRATPINENGKTFHAYTHWHLRWNFKFWTMGDGRCVIQEVDVTLNIDYTLPQLANTVKEEATLALFQRYVLALREHERGHAKNGIDAANEVETALRGLSTSSCQATELSANEKGQQILLRYNQLDKDYDKETQHGLTQGAVL